jgi:leucyl aminopeptidase
MRTDDRQPVVLEDVRTSVVRPEGLALEDEVGDAADQILDCGGTVVRQREGAHVVSVHRRHQEFVKRAKKFRNRHRISSDSIGRPMDVLSASDPFTAGADIVAVAVSGGAPAGLGASQARVSELLDAEGFRPEAGAATLLHLEGGTRIAVAGLGEEIDADAFRTAAAAVARLIRRAGTSIAWVLDESQTVAPDVQARAVVDGLAIGGYDPGRWKSEADGGAPVERVVFAGADGAVEEAQREATVLDWVSRARDLANEPPNELTPERMAERAEEIAGSSEHLSFESGGPERLAELGMGAFAAVAQGSHNPPRLIVLRYQPPGVSGDVVLGLVGKAITFDTGGVSIKPQLYMEDMKGDMAGGAAVLAGIGAIAELGLPVRVLGLVGAAENMVGGGAYRPGDILRAMNGKTIEVINTDAEGRLVLADLLAYARSEGATHVVDFATLTGAMNRALGDLYAGVFGNDDGWRDEVVAAGNRAGDHAWSWPMHRRYRRLVDSNFADMKNSSIRGQAVPVLAAEFLKEFVGDGAWAHVDMAGPGFLRWARPDYFMTPGGTGYGVRMIAELARSLT